MVENHYHDTEAGSSMSAAVVALVAILVIVLLGFFALRMLGVGIPVWATTDNSNGEIDVNVDLPDSSAPDSTTPSSY